MIGKVGRGEPPQYQVSTNELGHRVGENLGHLFVD